MYEPPYVRIFSIGCAWMKVRQETVDLSASDLANHLSCRHLTMLDLRLAKGELAEPFSGAGLWFVPIAHEGNRSYSAEEVECVSEIVASLTCTGANWSDRHGDRQPLTLDDILIVAPYNDQVNRLMDRLPGVRVGTVDKFQGQQAAIVIYSMTTSTPEDAPRGMEFLYNLNRFNVATSRARCACIVVGNPLLFSPECRTPRQMELANAVCRYSEMSANVVLDAHVSAAGGVQSIY